MKAQGQAWGFPQADGDALMPDWHSEQLLSTCTLKKHERLRMRCCQSFCVGSRLCLQGLPKVAGQVTAGATQDSGKNDLVEPISIHGRRYSALRRPRDGTGMAPRDSLPPSVDQSDVKDVAHFQLDFSHRIYHKRALPFAF